MLRDKINEVIEQAAQTSFSIAGGYMPHAMKPPELTAKDISFGLQRTCGWVVPPNVVEKYL